MPASTFALQQAIYTALTANAAVTAALGGPRIYDEVPQPVVFPYLSFGMATVIDDDTSTEHADQHMFMLHVWSRAPGRKEPLAIVDAVRAALHDQSPNLIGHRLINLRHEQTETRRTADGETLQSTLRFRAVTEPL